MPAWIDAGQDQVLLDAGWPDWLGVEAQRASASAGVAATLLFATAASGYILIGIKLEERELSRQLGQPYPAYSARVPALCPVPRRRGASDSFKTG